MEKHGILDKLIRLSKLCINKSKSKVRVDGETNDIFSINYGVKQGDGISPILFNLPVEEAMQKTKNYREVSIWELTNKMALIC